MPIDKLQFVSLQGEPIGLVDVYVSVFNEAGHNLLLQRVSRRLSHAGDEPFSSINHVELPKGTYRIVVAVRDQLSEAVGISMGKITL